MHNVDNDKCNISDKGMNSCHDYEYELEKFVDVDEEEVGKKHCQASWQD